ncbi:uncharacterized protein BDZ99DRAFT_568713 [Mytilinidion resinicola]|uniref:Uncharacterized protein n=1 Tax=Mytilinidion resinicola TaxID=574789 RepID=A0A6A6YYA6_9PEZI|nr:uncharacterized protein BDZ99DRAFT_568713 [Mytilinidion resinicola]KAF2813528.1 hypothetical protein BDZ99DRAFT_568713 [Mytilinidion resinicola]
MVTKLAEAVATNMPNQTEALLVGLPESAAKAVLIRTKSEEKDWLESKFCGATQQPSLTYSENEEEDELVALQRQMMQLNQKAQQRFQQDSLKKRKSVLEAVQAATKRHESAQHRRQEHGLFQEHLESSEVEQDLLADSVHIGFPEVEPKKSLIVKLKLPVEFNPSSNAQTSASKTKVESVSNKLKLKLPVKFNPSRNGQTSTSKAKDESVPNKLKKLEFLEKWRCRLDLCKHTISLGDKLNQMSFAIQDSFEDGPATEEVEAKLYNHFERCKKELLCAAAVTRLSGILRGL